MSTQKGNSSRTRSQKYKNRTAFKNDLHDTNHRTKLINAINVNNVCVRCKEIIEWKIKYKKYKPLTQAKTCVKCDRRNVKQAYHVMCGECGQKLQLCTKCCQAKEIVPNAPDLKEQLKLDNELKMVLQELPERKRRTFLRYMEKKNKDSPDEGDKDELISKLNELKCTSDDGDDDDFSLSDFDDE